MAFSVYLPLYVGIFLAVVTPRIGRTLPPSTEVWCLTIAAIVAAASLVFSLSMIAFTGLARLPMVADEGNMSADAWRALDPIAVWAAILAGICLCVAVALFLRATIGEVIAQHQVRRLSRGFDTDERLVFVDDAVPHAYAVGGRHPHIVISRGLVSALGAAERRAVLAHETAHLRYRHHAHLRVLRLTAALNPLLVPFVRAGVLAVERWADEETAVRVGDRTLVARTLLRAALAGTGTVPSGVLAHTTGDVGRRVTALMKAPPRQRWSAATLTSMLLVATIATPIHALSSLDALVNAASFDRTSTPARSTPTRPELGQPSAIVPTGRARIGTLGARRGG